MTPSAGCSEVGGLLQALVDGDLTAAERTSVEGHLAGCPSCTAEGARLRDNAAYLGEILSPLRMPADFGSDFLFRLPKKDPKRRAAPAPAAAPRSVVMGETRSRRGSPVLVIAGVVFLAAAGGLGWLFFRPPAPVARKDPLALPEVKERPPKGQGDADPRKTAPNPAPAGGGTRPSATPTPTTGGPVLNAADLVALVRSIKNDAFGAAIQRGWDLLAGTPSEGKGVRDAAEAEKDPKVRAALVLCLGASQDADLRAAVASFLADAAAEVRIAAALGLARSLAFEAPAKKQVPAGPPLSIAVSVGVLADDRTRSDLVGRLSTESDPAVRRVLVLALAPSAAADPTIRDRVLEGVRGAWGDELREVCVKALQGVQDAALVPALAEALTQPGTPKTLHGDIIETMLAADRNAAAEAIAGLVGQAESPELRRTLVQALGRAGGDAAKRGLLAVLSGDSEGAVRLTAIQGLNLFPDREVLEALQRAAENDGDHQVRQSAENAAKALGAKLDQPEAPKAD
ncbi:MAG TPA: HEAT repeat domain-containing protein [Planctomycetota bacterium]|nr:HEAT repeat domain-containing protein [Planctomycetota bacterium]